MNVVRICKDIVAVSVATSAVAGAVMAVDVMRDPAKYIRMSMQSILGATIDSIESTEE